MRISKTKYSLAALLLTLFFINSSIAYSNLKFYAFSDPNCQSCTSKLQPLLNTYGNKVIVYDIKASNNMLRFCKIVNFVGLEASELPLVGIFKNERLAAIVSGNYSEDDWERIVKAEYNGVPVYVRDTITPFKIIKEQNVTDFIVKLLMNVPLDEELDNAAVHTNIYYLLPLIIISAMVDAINPCEFYVLIVFLSLAIFRTRRKDVLKAGIAYSIAIFIVNYLMGFGLLKLITYARHARFFIVMIFGIFGLFIGFREILGIILNMKFKRVPDVFSSRLSAYLRKVSENPMTAFVIGTISGIFLLPCTSGPYFIAISLIADLETLLEGLFLLTVYNSIIMAPFLAITLGIHMLKLKTGELKRWASQKQKWLNLIAGLLMIFLSLYLLCAIIP